MIVVRNKLIVNIDKLHTTKTGVDRIKRNLNIDVDDVVNWCANMIMDEKAIIQRIGKNWYIEIYDYKITVNSTSYTIITAHKI